MIAYSNCSSSFDHDPIFFPGDPSSFLTILAEAPLRGVDGPEPVFRAFLGEGAVETVESVGARSRLTADMVVGVMLSKATSMRGGSDDC